MALARTALVPVADKSALSQVRYLQLNPTLAAEYPGFTSFLNRPSRFAPLMAFVGGMMIGAVALWQRRLELASALHSGLPKAFLLLQTVAETAAWALCGLILAAPWILFAASRATADGPSIGLTGLRSLLTGVLGAVIGTAVAASASRERSLFKLFKNR